jgi:hypothetical protein
MVAVIFAASAPLFSALAGAHENGCTVSAAVEEDTEAREHWIACNKELVKGELRDGRPDWVNPGMEWRNVSAHKTETGDTSWSVCGEVSQRDGLGRFEKFQRFISRGNDGLVIVEGLYAEKDNYVWWRKMPFDHLWKKYCE